MQKKKKQSRLLWSWKLLATLILPFRKWLKEDLYIMSVQWVELLRGSSFSAIWLYFLKKFNLLLSSFPSFFFCTHLVPSPCDSCCIDPTHCRSSIACALLWVIILVLAYHQHRRVVSVFLSLSPYRTLPGEWVNMAYTLNTPRGTILFNSVYAFANIVHELSFVRDSGIFGSLYSSGTCSLDSSNSLSSLFLGRLIRVSFSS